MKILIDTNVLVSGLIAKGACFEILSDLVYAHTPLVTPYIHAECQDVFLHKFHLSGKTIKEILSVVDRYFVKGKSSVNVLNVCRDLKDNQVLVDALINEADVILSGDKDLLSMGQYEGIAIVAPKDYWKL